MSSKKNKDENLPGFDTQILQAEMRTHQAEARTEQAKTRIEQAETRTEAAEMRTESAETRTEAAKTRTEQAETRTEAAEMRSVHAIHTSELGYRRLFDTAPDGILILDADNGQVVDANPFMKELLGYSLEEFLGMKLWEIGPFKGEAASKITFAELKLKDRIHYKDLPLETKDGRRVEIEFISTAYFVDQKKLIQCNLRNITERKRAEAEILRLNMELERRVGERTAQLQDANEKLEAFSYSVSHDLRAPLRHVLGFVELLQQDAGPSLSEKNLRHLTTISDSAKRMGDLIDDLLEFARVGRAELKKTEINLDELIRDTFADFQAEMKNRSIVLKIHPLPSVLGDRALLRMVLVNLISNAVKFTGQCAEAKIEIGCVETVEGERGEGRGERGEGESQTAQPSTLNAGPSTTIYVRDNGAGFDPHYADKLFGVFQRLHSQTEFEGTGIGLANVQRIIHRHGGKTWAEGVVDGGATFYFSLPKPNGATNGH